MNVYNPWSDDELATLRKLREDGHSFGEISKRIKRSRNSIASKCSKLGLQGIATVKGRKPRLKVLPWNDPDRADKEHDVDTRDLAILDAIAAGRAPGAIAREFRLPESYVRELWRIRELQDPVGEDA